MSRQFWRSAFSGTRSSSMIECLKVVTNWSAPPDKDDATTPTTPQVAQAAADYQSHLGSLPVPTNATETATLAMLSELEKWGVEAATSDEIGADITDEEVEAVCANLPVGKAPGPDRIPNEYYKVFSAPLAPLLAAAYNAMRNDGESYEGFSDGYVSHLYTRRASVTTFVTTVPLPYSTATTRFLPVY